MNCRQALGILALSLITGCSAPKRWSETVEFEVRCDMSVAEVHALAQRPVRQLNNSNSWITHVIEDGGTELRLGYENEGLKWVQIAWTLGPNRTATFQKIDLCGLDPDNPDVAQRLIRR